MGSGEGERCSGGVSSTSLPFANSAIFWLICCGTWGTVKRREDGCTGGVEGGGWCFKDACSWWGCAVQCRRCACLRRMIGQVQVGKVRHAGILGSSLLEPWKE